MGGCWGGQRRRMHGQEGQLALAHAGQMLRNPAAAAAGSCSHHGLPPPCALSQVSYCQGGYPQWQREGLPVVSGSDDSAGDDGEEAVAATAGRGRLFGR